jgi:hypothetical protein
MKVAKDWFSVDTKGLRNLQAGKPKTFIVRELIQNAWDEHISECKVDITKQGRNITVTVTDDSPEGFRDIRHAYTLFADTYKRRDPEKRGRFNIGEKQAFSVCEKIELRTTKGALTFNRNGRHTSRNKTAAGTIIRAEFAETQAELDELLTYAKSLLVPKGIRFEVNGEHITSREPFKVSTAELYTEIDDNGTFRKTTRKTQLEIYEKEGKAYLYEMGLPVCEIDCQFSVNVQQKVPLSIDRETVSQAYLQDVFAEVLNLTHDRIEAEQSSELWVREATRDERISKEALDDVIHKRFGEKVCVANPFDQHSIDEALSRGFKVVTGSELSKEEWTNIKQAELMKSSSDMFGMSVVNAPSIDPTADMRKVAALAKKIAKRILGNELNVRFVKHSTMVAAQYEKLSNTLTFNVAKLGSGFFAETVSAPVLNLVLHELGHHGGSHTESGYHETLTKLGAELTIIALRDPSFFGLSLNS